MRLRPTLRATHLCALGIVATALGLTITHPAMTAYGSAMLVGIALSRALTRVSVARARAAGFEMLWTTPQPTMRATREHEFTLVAELRNRDNLPTLFRDLHVSHSSGLTIRCSIQEGEVPARGRLRISLFVMGHRVGYHGIHSITLQTIRAPGLYTVPLSFSNPFVVKVLPRTVRLGLAGAAGGRARTAALLSMVGSKSGDGAELREIREHRPGDPYRRIAWKASARRGRLLIIEKEEDQNDTVWLILESSADSASGLPGRAALDSVIDLASSRLELHLARGDKVGLAIVGIRVLKKIDPGSGPRHRARLLSALTLDTHSADADRCDWDELDIARHVLVHMAALDSRAHTLLPFEHEKITKLAAQLQKQAPVQAEVPWSTSHNDSILRRYLLSYGIQPPPRGLSDRYRAEATIGRFLLDIKGRRPRPSLIYLFAHPPGSETPHPFLRALSQTARRHTELRFVPMLESVAIDETKSPSLKQQMVQNALNQRQKLATEEGLQELSHLGVKVLRDGRIQDRQRRMAYYLRSDSPIVQDSQ